MMSEQNKTIIRRIYEEIFVRCVLDEARRRQRYFPDLPPLRFPRGRLTWRAFDDHYTAPRCGFTCALDYYHRASVTSLLAHIAVPALILTALVLACGLAALVLSDLPPLRLFGWLGAFAMLAALVADLLILRPVITFLLRSERRRAPTPALAPTIVS